MESETFCKDVCAFIHKFVNMFWPVRTSGLLTLKFLFLVRLIKDISRFGSLSGLNVFSYEQENKSIKAAFRQTSKRIAMRMDEMAFGLDSTQTNTSSEMSCGKNIFLNAFVLKCYYTWKKKEFIL